MTDVISAFEAGQYTDVIMTLEARPPQGIREFTLLGLALLRTGRFPEAETPLTQAAVLGDPEAQVELGNLLRLLGRFEEAVSHFETISAGLTGELQLRALRWWGMAEFQGGHLEEGLRRCERAWYGYMALGDGELTARVTQSLAWLHSQIGDFTRAKQLYGEAIRALPVHPVPFPRLAALTNLLDLHLQTGDFRAAHETLSEAERTLSTLDAPRQKALLLTGKAELLRLTGDFRGYAFALDDLAPLAEALRDHRLRVWVASRRAEHFSLHGQHGRALEELHTFGRVGTWTPELWATSGVLARRRGDLRSAVTDLEHAVGELRRSGPVPDLIRALLHLAGAQHKAGLEPTAALQEALRELLNLRHYAAFRPDLEELRDLLHHALLEPELAPYLEPVLDRLAALNGSPRLPEDGLMHMQVSTLGRVQVVKDGTPVDFELRGAPLLLAYLALHPGKTRAEVQLELYPDKDVRTGAGYIRAAIHELRQTLGREVVIFEGPHNAPRYRLGHLVHVDLDMTGVTEAVNRGEVARALALYRGPFMPGVEDSAWVRHKREEVLLSLTFELRTQMARYQAEGDLKRVILLANQYLRIDPFEREVLEERVAAAREVASPQELARYTAELNRHLYN